MIKNLFEEPLLEIFDKHINLSKLNEIRLRINKPIIIYVSSKPYYLAYTGITNKKEDAIITSREMLYNIIKRASEHSLYAINNQLKQGFITVLGGVRIGVCGEIVVEDNVVKTIKNFSSINIRIAREIKNCSINIFDILLQGGFNNTLIVSSPGCGKTTMIRDILFQLSQRSYAYNVLLVDERFEIANCFNGLPTLDVGDFTDVISGHNKAYSFENGIRSMSPDILVTDELSSQSDIDAVLTIANSGVKLLASVHAKDIDDLKEKKQFKQILDQKVFKRIVVISKNRGPGTIEGVFDENFRCLYV